MFAWVPIPEPYKALGSASNSAKLLVEKADVAVAPGIGFGEHGDDYVRIAIVENEHRIRQAARGIKRFLRRARALCTMCWTDGVRMGFARTDCLQLSQRTSTLGQKGHTALTAQSQLPLPSLLRGEGGVRGSA